MSLTIDVDRVAAVLLGDGWHQVATRSFNIDSYEYIWTDGDTRTLLHEGGRSGVCATGFTFLEDLDENAGGAYVGDEVRVCGPMTAILAVIERQ